MRIFDKLKRMYYRYKNNDPFYNCDCFKKESCCMVDGPFCDISKYEILANYMGEKYVNCDICTKSDICLSDTLGKGCFEGTKK